MHWRPLADSSIGIVPQGLGANYSEPPEMHFRRRAIQWCLSVRENLWGTLLIIDIYLEQSHTAHALAGSYTLLRPHKMPAKKRITPRKRMGRVALF